MKILQRCSIKARMKVPACKKSAWCSFFVLFLSASSKSQESVSQLLFRTIDILLADI